MHTCFSHVLRYHRTFFHVESNSRVHCALEKLIQDLGQKTKFIYYYMSVQLKVHSLLRIAFCVTWKFLVFTVEQRFKKRLIAHELLLLNRSLQVFFFSFSSVFNGYPGVSEMLVCQSVFPGNQVFSL